MFLVWVLVTCLNNSCSDPPAAAGARAPSWPPVEAEAALGDCLPASEPRRRFPGKRPAPDRDAHSLTGAGRKRESRDLNCVRSLQWPFIEFLMLSDEAQRKVKRAVRRGTVNGVYQKRRFAMMLFRHCDDGQALEYAA
ncbi:hypothetical protein V5799_025406 [Amblyomma americanum]|uniref:Secreted protein n=1 Tax=Amblyomma americanum TaxID=6943 RepID=A0AAQ4E9N4_AMBAM